MTPEFLGNPVKKGKIWGFWAGGEAYPDTIGANSRFCNLDFVTIVLIESGRDSCYDFNDTYASTQ
jgi:hypothetical protein